ncbi:MAG: hypothetical protein JWP73_1534 [Phenylobacterium sp.]|nr:hypothetical protein [Phenylobacterium sp.]
MLSLRYLAAAAALGCLLGAAGPVAARGTFVYAKPGAARADMQAQGQACWDEARGIRPPSAGYLVYRNNPAATAAGALGAGLAQGFLQARAQQRSVETCMRAHGFGKLELTAEEVQDLQTAKTDAARASWLDGFLAKDLTARITTALTPAADPMPAAKTEPYVVGGVRLDPAKLTLSTGPVKAGEPLLAGVAAHRRTAVLMQDFQVSRFLDERAEAGGVFHEVSYQARPEGGLSGDTQWCGPISNNSIRGRVTQPRCITAGFEGYEVVMPTRAELWLQGNGHPVLAPRVIKGSQLALRPSDKDLLGPLDVTVKVDRIAKGGVGLEAVAQNAKGKVTFWEGFVRWDANGAGELPFWGQTLRLKRQGDAVEAQLTPDGDGRGWLEIGADKGQSIPAV